MRLNRGQQTSREVLPIRTWKRPPGDPSDLVLDGVYLVYPDEEEVYATRLGDNWFLTGEERSFVVDKRGVVTEVTDGAGGQPTMTLNDFFPTFRFMGRCLEHNMVIDWDHANVCP